MQVVVTLIDRPQKIENVLLTVQAMVRSGLIILQTIEARAPVLSNELEKCGNCHL